MRRADSLSPPAQGPHRIQAAEKRLVSDGKMLVCPNTGARWHFEQYGPQLVLRQNDPETHLTRRRRR